MAAASTSDEGQNNLETYSVVWLDPAANQAKEFLEVQKQLRQLTNHLKVFDDVEKCHSYIKSMPKEDRIIFISNVRLGQDIVPQIYSLQQIFNIYIYQPDSKQSNSWTTDFPKIKGIGMQLKALINQILSDHTTRDARRKVDETLSINIFSTNNSDEKSTMGLNGQFIYSQLLVDHLLCVETKETDRKEFIKLCEEYYKDNSSELKIIKEFEKDYSADRSLWWYTRESFLYRLLNKALRTQNIDLLFLFRFFIRDLHQQIREIQYSTPIRVYRGQVVSKDEFQVLKASIGQFISMNSFLSTSFDRRLAVSFLTSSTLTDNLQRVLFEIDLDPTLKNIKPFADITSKSFFTDEREVLIMLGSIFQLVNIDYQDRVAVIQMTLCSDDDNSLKPIYDYIKKEYDENGTGSSIFSFGILLFKMGQYDKAEKYYNRLINELPPDHNDIGPCYHNLGMIANHRGKYDTSLERFNKALEVYQRTRKSDDPAIAKTYNSIGEVYFRQGKRANAIESFKKALDIRKKAFGDDNLDVAACYHNLGNAYQEEKNFQQAFEYHQKALMIRQKHLPPNHPDIGSSVHCIAGIYLCCNQPSLALEYYNKALAIYQKSLTSQHQDVGMIHYNLGLLYAGQNNFQQALTNFEKASSIFHVTLAPTHPFIGIVNQDIQRISNMLK